jgi:hypothetical protein
MLTFTDQLLTVANAYSALTGAGFPTVSSRVFDDSKRLPLIASGEGSITLRRAELALQWFSANWPDGADWPSEIARPEPLVNEAAE